MDLINGYPRSVKDKFAGVVMLGRAIDKGRATLAGTNGEYNYDCPMDKAVFELLGIDKETFTKELGRNDADLEKHVKETYVAKVDPAKIEEFNRDFVASKPQNADSQAYFDGLLKSVAPDRTDITAWADLLDLDEKRQVPVKTPA